MESYQQKLNPWIVICTQPDQERNIVARFRRRSEAEGRLRVLKQKMPQAEFAIAFECNKDTLSSSSGWSSERFYVTR